MNRKQKMKAALDSLFTSPKTLTTNIEQLPAAIEAKIAEIPEEAPINGQNHGNYNGQIEAAPQNGRAAVAIEEPLAVRTQEDIPQVSSPGVVKEPVQAETSSQVSAGAVDPSPDPAVDQVERHLVVFQLCDEFYGVDISVVEAIIKMQPITTVPHTPVYVQGVTNLRGTVLPVFDLRKRFGLEAKAFTKNSRIVVVRNHGNSLGMVVDSVAEVLRVPAKDCEPTPKIVNTVDSTYISGIARTEDQLVILLDLDRVLRVQQRGS